MNTNLEIFTLGGLVVRCGGAPVTGFRSRKVPALLAYLAVHPQPQPRELLADLLWEERSQAQALSNLRVVLSDLRKNLGEALEIGRERVGLRQDAALWIDRAELAGAAPARAVELYQGEFLQGFYAPDARKFDAWLLGEREQCRQQILGVLQHLVAAYRRSGDAPAALRYARRWVELDRLSEMGHVELVRLLAAAGRRVEAVAQAAAYRQLLQEELGVAPSAEMDALARQCQGAPAEIVPGPRVGQLAAAAQPADPKIFVGRQEELAGLEGRLRLACSGRGQLVFICGEAGSGKTALLAEFAHQAQQVCADVLVVSGSCTVFSGTGDPFLPFRDILAHLVGAVEKPLRAGTLTPQQANRLWESRAVSLQAVLQHGTDLVGSFIPLHLIHAALPAPEAEWQHDLVELARQKAAWQDPYPWPANLMEPYAAVLTAAARQQPVLLLLDDLQWADPASVSLLCHLASRIQAEPILLVGAYRPEAAADAQNAFGRVLSEFKRQLGDSGIDLDRRPAGEALLFTNALLDAQPNRLDANFRRHFVRQSGGQALFAVELLRELQSRGLLVRDERGRWVENGTMNWAILPAKVEAVVEMRTRQLDDHLLAILKTASVVGEEFSAEMLAGVLGLTVLDLIKRLNVDLVKKSRLIQELGLTQVGAQRFSQYRFSQGVFQRYFYDQMGYGERAYLHERVAQALEELHNGQPEELADAAAQLAWHFQQAGCPAKAIDYHLLAGNRAAQFGASESAVSHFKQGLDLLPRLAEEEPRRAKELALRLAACAPLQALRGYTDPEVRQTYLRVKELSVQMKHKLEVLPALYLLRTFHHTPEERQTAFELAEELLRPGEAPSDPCLTSIAHWTLGSELAYRGEFAQARWHLEQAASRFDARRDGWLIQFYGNHPGIAARARLAWVLWFMGYPDQARAYSREALALAEQSQNALVRGFALGRAGVMFHQIVGEVAQAQRWNEASREFSAQAQAALFNPAETISAGWIKAELGELAEGLEWMRQGLANWHTSGAVMHLPHYLAMYAAVLAKAGQVETGLTVVAEALEAAQHNHELYYAAELWRLRGELLQMKMAVLEAEQAFKTALEIARAQAAPGLELRACLSLARLRRQHGQPEQADDELARLYAGFNEGFDTPDMRAAHQFLGLGIPAQQG